MSGKSYIVLGAGSQGVAAAFDLALNGNSARLTLADGVSPRRALCRSTDQKTPRGPRRPSAENKRDHG
ncbi:MAG: hypothetical protein IPN90_08685 [Elusimicrobia bacterium]|nr:hypothetical protein [Elusimicrobiota bacterium]